MRNKRAVINLLPTAKARLTQNLPEYNLLDFLLNSPYTVDLKAYVDNYEHIPDTDAYKGKFLIYATWLPLQNEKRRFSGRQRDAGILNLA